MTKTKKVNKQASRDMDEYTDEETVTKWQSEFSNALIEEVHRLIEQQEEVYGREFGDLARFNVITGLISSAVFKALLDVPKNNIKDIHAATTSHHLAYKDVTHAIQSAVECGFEGAAKVWSGKPTEYFCQIQIVPEPRVKLEN